MIRRYYTSATAYGKVFNADFQTIMSDMGFSGTPREVLTIKDMIIYHTKLQAEGRDYE